MAEGGSYLLELWAAAVTAISGWNYISHRGLAREIKECSDGHASKDELQSAITDLKVMTTEVRTDVKDLSKVVYKMAGVQCEKD